jgi:hypothetical protein
MSFFLRKIRMGHGLIHTGRTPYGSFRIFFFLIKIKFIREKLQKASNIGGLHFPIPPDLLRLTARLTERQATNQVDRNGEENMAPRTFAGRG